MKIILTNHHLRMSLLFFEKKTSIILKHLKLNHVTLEISFVSDATIKGLNKKFRHVNRPTDVLSFPLNSPQEIKQHPDCHLGDILISLETAKKQALMGKVPLKEECLFLIQHGILHLLGYDHMKKNDFIKMQKMEKNIWKQISKIPFEKMSYLRH